MIHLIFWMLGKVDDIVDDLDGRLESFQDNMPAAHREGHKVGGAWVVTRTPRRERSRPVEFVMNIAIEVVRLLLLVPFAAVSVSCWLIHKVDRREATFRSCPIC